MIEVKMHGISNCDSIKKAKTWLHDADIEFSFRDYKKNPPSLIEVQAWAQQVGWEQLLNKRGTTWRKLPEVVQNNVNQTNVCGLLLEQPSMIKRPLLVIEDEQQIQVVMGFKPQQYANIFKL